MLPTSDKLHLGSREPDLIFAVTEIINPANRLRGLHRAWGRAVRFLFLSLTVMSMAGCLERTEIQKLDERATPLCKVYFGGGDEHCILVGRTEDSLLIYRQGNVDAEPESYSMPSNRLGTDTTIPPFKFGGVSYSITGCNEFIDEEPKPRNSLMIYVNIEDGNFEFSQYCDVAMSAKTDSLEVARFDSRLTVGPATTNYVPDPLIFNLGGEPTNVRACVGTVDQAAGCWTVVSVQNGDECAFADGLRPTMNIEFPAEGGKSLAKRYLLDEFC